MAKKPKLKVDVLCSCGGPIGCATCGKPLMEMSPAFLIKLAARLMRSQAKAGRKKVLEPCDFCGQEFGVVEMRSHIVHCPERYTEAGIANARRAQRKRARAEANDRRGKRKRATAAVA